MNLTKSKHFEFLQNVSIFKNLEKEELESVLKYLFLKEIAENELVFARLEKEQILYQAELLDRENLQKDIREHMELFLKLSEIRQIRKDI